MEYVDKTKSHWYVLQIMSGQENRAFKAIQTRRELDARDGLDDGVDDIKIPMDIVEVVQTNAKGGKTTVKKERTRYPGYILIQARLYQADGHLNAEVWDMIKNTQGVIGFVGGENPVRLSKSEVVEMMRVEEESETAKPKVLFNVGETVTIKNGAFQGFNAVVEAIDSERARLKVSVNIFGRATAVELEMDEVEKAS